MKKMLVVLLTCIYTISAFAQKVQLEKAASHPMRYYISLPAGWNEKQEWPVLISIEAAEKEFAENARRFAVARGNRPYIIVCPVTTTNGNYGLRDPNVYPYSNEEWDRIDKETNCRFDEEGLRAVLADVRGRFHGQSGFYLTGFEAGTHLVWSMLFQHPENMLAAAPVAGNYIGRCVSATFSTNAARNTLPICNFTTENDEYFGLHGKAYGQYLKARQLAIAHGFKNISDKDIPGKGHEPVPAEVLAWFDSLRKK